MDNKYYTPDIGDLRIGYQCEIKCYLIGEFDTEINPQHTQWVPHIISPGVFSYMQEGERKTKENILLLPDDITTIRTPFLTKEQIEAEGWRVESDYGAGTTFIKQAEWKGELFDTDFRLLTHKYAGLTYQKGGIVIFKRGMFESIERIFIGKCPSINEFRTLMKWLNITNG